MGKGGQTLSRLTKSVSWRLKAEKAFSRKETSRIYGDLNADFTAKNRFAQLTSRIFPEN